MKRAFFDITNAVGGKTRFYGSAPKRVKIVQTNEQKQAILLIALSNVYILASA